LEKRRLANVCKADLKWISKRLGAEEAAELTIPLFKLLPGLPSRTFSSFTAFFGGIFFFA
jgi:hypothetical protein